MSNKLYLELLQRWIDDAVLMSNRAGRPAHNAAYRKLRRKLRELFDLESQRDAKHWSNRSHPTRGRFLIRYMEPRETARRKHRKRKLGERTLVQMIEGKLWMVLSRKCKACGGAEEFRAPTLPFRPDLGDVWRPL